MDEQRVRVVVAELKPADLAESPLRTEGAAAQRELRAEGDALLGDELERLEHVHILAHNRPRTEAHAGAFARARAGDGARGVGAEGLQARSCSASGDAEAACARRTVACDNASSAS